MRSIKQKVRYLYPTVRLDGLNLSESLFPYFIQAKYPNGTYLGLELLVHPSRLSEVDRLAQHLWNSYSNSQSISLKELLDDDYLPLNATISAVRWLRSSLLAGLEDQPLSVSVTSPMTESEERSMANGGLIHRTEG